MWTEHSKSHASHHVVAWGLQAVEVNVSVLKGEFLVVPPLLVLRAGKEKKWKNVSFQYFLERKRAKSCHFKFSFRNDQFAYYKKCRVVNN